MLMLCLLAVISAVYTGLAYQSCTWSNYPNQSIPGGQAATVSSLAECQAACAQTTGCKSLDFNPSDNGCWLLTTQDGKISNPGIQHYDFNCVAVDPCSPNPCQNGGSCSASGQGYQCACASGFTGTNCEASAVRDIVASTGDARCFRTNYPGPVTDLWTAPNGVQWNFQLASFGFDWPQSSVLGIQITGTTFIESLSFGSSDNLDYFRVVFKTNTGKTITTNPIGPNDRSVSLSGVENVKRVDFYLSPVDFRRNVTLNDINLRTCGYILFFKDCTLFNLLTSLLQIGSLGIIRPGGASGTFSATIAPTFPFIDLDLSCAGFGTVTFSQVNFDRNSGFNTVVVEVWDGARVVPVYDKNGVYSSSFNLANGVYFSSSVRGNRIRSTIIPYSSQDKGITGSIWFSRYSVLAS